MLLCGRILLGARSPRAIFPPSLARKDYAHEAHTFGWSLAMDLLFPKILFILCQMLLECFDPNFLGSRRIFSDKKLEIHNPIV